MGDGVNKVMLLGNVGSDPEFKDIGGNPLLKFSIATNESYKDKAGVKQENVSWHRVSLWGKRAEALQKHITKGTKLFVEGKIRYGKYTNKEGVEQYSTDIIADNIAFAGGGKSDGNAAGGDFDDSDLPDAFK